MSDFMDGIKQRVKQDRELASRYPEVCRLLHQVLHQRTGPMGLKVEDDLLRENEPLLRRCLEHTRNL